MCQDLLDAVKGSTLPVRPIEELKEEVESIVGGPPTRPSPGERPVAVIKWGDGTAIDTVWEVTHEGREGG